METPKEPSTEELTKEELLKKYKKLLLIARQAKQAKDGMYLRCKIIEFFY